MKQETFSFIGAELRDEGTEAIAENNPDWMETAAETLTALVHAHGVVHADLLRRKLPDPPHPNCIGAVFLAASRSGLIRESGRRITSRAFHSTHARKITVWELNKHSIYEQPTFNF